MLFQSALWALSLFSFVAGQSNDPVNPNHHWVSTPGLPGPSHGINPAVYRNNTVWPNNSTQPLQWVADFLVNISCYQEGPDASRRLFVYSDPVDGSNPQSNKWWNVSIPYEWFLDGEGNVFYFAVYNLSKPASAPVFVSHYFNVTQSTKAASSSSNAVAIGAGVGGGVGGALLLAAIGYGIYYMRKRSKKQRQQQQKQAITEAAAVSDHAELPSPSPNEKYGPYVDHAGQYAPTQYDSHYGGSPLGSPAPAYKPGYEVSQELGHDNPHDAAHELDSTVNRR